MIEQNEDGSFKPMRISIWDVIGMTLHTAGTVLDAIDTGLRMGAAHCAAMADYTRERRAEQEAEWAAERQRQIMAKALDDGEVDWAPEDLT